MTAVEVAKMTHNRKEERKRGLRGRGRPSVWLVEPVATEVTHSCVFPPNLVCSVRFVVLCECDESMKGAGVTLVGIVERKSYAK